MDLPSELKVSGTELLVADQVAVEVPKTTPIFRRWNGPAIADDYGGKAVLEYKGRPQFAEFLILRILEEAGWTGMWIDTFRRRCLVDHDCEVEVPAERRHLLEAIADRAGSQSGAFDVFAWRNGDILFAESKRRGRDRIRETQVKWAAAALASGLSRESLLVVEWKTEEEAG